MFKVATVTEATGTRLSPTSTPNATANDATASAYVAADALCTVVGTKTSPPINTTAVATRNIANAVFTSVFCIKLEDIARIYLFMKRDERKH
jgi:hypothetical protein